MKKLTYLFLFLFIGSITFTSCLSDQCTDQLEYFRYDRIYFTASEFRISDIETEDQRQLENPGKMYYYKDMLFINEKGFGIHIYDNSDKEDPTFLTFYKIPGNFDIVIKDDLLVADNVIDMITIDISDLYNPTLVSRIEDFNDSYSWVTNDDHQFFAYSIPSPVKQIVDCGDSNFGRNNFQRGNVFYSLDDIGIFSNEKAGSTSDSGSGGISGSTARFIIVGDYMYTVDNSSLLSFEFSDGNPPSFVTRNNIGWGIETIFPLQDKLFIGSTSGMYIFSLDNPASPSKLSTFEHARACDPVVVEGNTAYVTLRDGNTCNGFTNQLDVIDITNLTNPKLIKSYSMANPHGLSVHNGTMYLSEGIHGLKILDVNDAQKVKEVSWDKNAASTDVIYLGNNHLLSIGSDGFYQYDVTDPKNIKQLSFIPVR